jgi:CTP:molybdopterin cytidylyltransferase MocA
MAGEVARLSPEQGINALLAMRPVCQFDAGDASLGVDVDTPEEYQTLCRVAGRQGNQT